jgi:hypothetical protein
LTANIHTLRVTAAHGVKNMTGCFEIQ